MVCSIHILTALWAAASVVLFVVCPSVAELLWVLYVFGVTKFVFFPIFLIHVSWILYVGWCSGIQP